MQAYKKKPKAKTEQKKPQNKKKTTAATVTVFYSLIYLFNI